MLRKPLLTLLLAMAVLNLLDYLTTVYALTNVPNAYEANFELADPELMFKVKMVNNNLVIVLFLGIAVILERLKDYDRITKLTYRIQLAVLLYVVVSYFLTVFNNAYICVTHENPGVLSTLLDFERDYLHLHYNSDSDYLLKLPNLFK